jgi:HTH-like domain
VSDHQAEYPIATMSRLLAVSSSGYHVWIMRWPSRRCETDAALNAEIRAARAASRGIHGAPRIYAALAAKGICVGRKRVACQSALNIGSGANLVQGFAVDHAAPSRRAWRRSSFARPYICRFTNFSFVFCPSVWPFDQGCVIAAWTPARSCTIPLEQDPNRPGVASMIQDPRSALVRCWIMR